VEEATEVAEATMMGDTVAEVAIGKATTVPKKEQEN
jgi:hypothetical protein